MFLTITRQVFWLIPIARLVGPSHQRIGLAVTELRNSASDIVDGKIQQRVLPRILTCVPFSAIGAAIAGDGHHIIMVQSYNLFSSFASAGVNSLPPCVQLLLVVALLSSPVAERKRKTDVRDCEHIGL